MELQRDVDCDKFSVSFAFYVVIGGRILAFVGQSDADRYISEQGAGKKISYDQLTGMEFD